MSICTRNVRTLAKPDTLYSYTTAKQYCLHFHREQSRSMSLKVVVVIIVIVVVVAVVVLETY